MHHTYINQISLCHGFLRRAELPICHWKVAMESLCDQSGRHLWIIIIPPLMALTPSVLFSGFAKCEIGWRTTASSMISQSLVGCLHFLVDRFEQSQLPNCFINIFWTIRLCPKSSSHSVGGYLNESNVALVLHVHNIMMPAMNMFYSGKVLSRASSCRPDYTCVVMVILCRFLCDTWLF